MATIQLGKEPGVYVQEVVNSALSITEARLKVAGLVGHASPTLLVKDIVVTRSEDTDTDTIPGVGAEFVKDVLCVSKYVGAYGTNLPQYVQATDESGIEPDYIADGNEIIWLNNAPADKTTYYVTAIVAKDDTYYVPKFFTDINAVKAYYGPECYINDNGVKVVNEITVGARLMFNNGADRIWICEAQQVVDGEGHNVPFVANVKAAIDLLDDKDIQSLVVMYQTQEIQSYIKSRVVIDSATENGKERVGFICALSDDADAIVTQCTQMHEQRIVNVVPAHVNILVEDDTVEEGASEFTVQSTFAAAAAVGQLVDNSRLVSEPLTRKTLTGIYAISKVYTRDEIEKMSAAGAFVLKQGNGIVTVNQAVTTDPSNQNNRELSVVLIKDEVLKDVRDELDVDYIGRAYSRRTTPTKIKTSIISILNGYLDTLIEGFDAADIVVTPDTADTTRVNVSIAFAVLRPLNYIYISFMVTI